MADKIKILIVDDELFARNTLKRLLYSDYTQLYEAEDGYEGLIQYDKIRPDIIIVDLLIKGGIGGEWLIEKLLSSYKKPNIIVCSGKPQSELLKYKLMGAKACIHKPVKFNELWKIINDITSEA